MNKIMQFEDKRVEVFEFNGQVLFNPKDVAECLGIKNVNDNLRGFNSKQVIKLTNSEVGNSDIRKLNNAGENFLTESGVYKLIFKSKKKEAERFQDWVTDEVLPQIRKTGEYSVNNQNPMQTLDLTNQMANLMQNTQMMAQVVQGLVSGMGYIQQYVQDSIQSKDLQIDKAMELIGLRSKNVARLTGKLKEILFEQNGAIVKANDIEYLKARDRIFKEFDVTKWEEIPVGKYSSVFAYIEEVI